jgi:hypothetical protein
MQNLILRRVRQRPSRRMGGALHENETPRQSPGAGFS